LTILWFILLSIEDFNLRNVKIVRLSETQLVTTKNEENLIALQKLQQKNEAVQQENEAVQQENEAVRQENEAVRQEIETVRQLYEQLQAKHDDLLQQLQNQKDMN